MSDAELRGVLAALSWSYSDLARFLACAEVSVFRWATGKARPHGLTLAALQALAEAATSDPGRGRARELLRRGGAAALLTEALG